MIVPEEDLRGPRLPNIKMFSSSHLYRHAFRLFTVFNELSDTATVDGVLSNRKQFKAVLSEMQGVSVPFNDLSSIALLRVVHVLEKEHGQRCIQSVANLRSRSIDVSRRPRLNNSVVNTSTSSLSVESPEERRKLKQHYTYVLKSWAESHSAHPFPSKSEKMQLCKEATITERQLNNWFTNYRRRHCDK